MNRGERIRALARANGFSLVGIAKVPADGRAPGADFFTEWIARGRHGPLAYLADTAAQRVRLHERFSWARSVLCVGACHDGPAAKSRLDGLEARGPGTQPSWVPGRDLLSRVAGYARGRDYHLVFERRLKAVARALIAERLCGRTHWHVDTGPVLERAWAAAAGLGWIGKNNCLIHPRYGSYILLGEILLDAEVEADVAQPDRCGTCRRCLEACPTGALRGPRDLDAARCIATWTLETKGAPSNDSAIAAHGWVAGCDLCQNVCPFNGPRRAGAGDPELAVAGWHDLDLARTILLSRDEYDRLFRASALRRVGWQGLRLNAIRAAATCRDSATRAALRACLEDPDPQIREAAQQALNVAV